MTSGQRYGMFIMKTKTKTQSVTIENLAEKATRVVELEERLEIVRANRSKAITEAAAPFDNEITELEAAIKALTPPVEDCIVRNAATLFAGEDRSKVLGSVRVGLRFTPYSVAKPSRTKWDEIAQKMHHDGAAYVRLTPEVDRQKMLADRTSDDEQTRFILGQTMVLYGLKFSQDENVIIEKA